MLTLARRLFWLAVLGGVGYALYTTWQRRNEPVPSGPAEWPPFDDVPTTNAATASPATTPGSADVAPDDGQLDRAPLPDLGTVAPTTAPLPDLGHRPDPVVADASEPTPVTASNETSWVEPTDGVCPVEFPIKGNANSGIYHVPGGRFYDRTVPERCYATEDAAVADGYRRAKA